MDLKLDVRKSVEENASDYFDKAKKFKKKIDGCKKAIEDAKKKVKEVEEKNYKMESRKEESGEKRDKHWYEKFRWFISSSGFLVIGGKDATTNEIVIKKHADKGDLIFHTDLPGSPFVVIKSEGKVIDKKTKEEAATFCATFSKAWKAGVTVGEVYAISPDQVKKELGLPKGSFMIYGKREYFTASIELCIGVDDENKIMSGPCNAVIKNCKQHLVLLQGSLKASDIAKKIKQEFHGEVDEIIRALPGGTFEIQRKS